METDFPFNITLFNAINAAPDANPMLVFVGKIIATYSPWAVIAILLFVWFTRGVGNRRALMVAGVAMGIGMSTNFIITSLCYAPRPFEMGIVRTLLAHRLETSFPSDHVTFLLSLGFGLWACTKMRPLAWTLVGIGIVTAWARVYLGVHFPLDVGGSLVISLAAAALSKALAGILERPFFANVERLHSALFSRFTKRQ